MTPEQIINERCEDCRTIKGPYLCVRCVRRALTAETEGCAKVADDKAARCKAYREAHGGPYFEESVARGIAREIRESRKT